jgi:soluble lytic murein transglycosylase-like protein
LAIALFACGAPLARAVEHVTLANGFELDCVRREVRPAPQGDKVRIYFAPSSAGAEPSYVDVPAASIVRVETLPDPMPTSSAQARLSAPPDLTQTIQPTPAELNEMLARAGTQHHIDAQLLASVVHAESGGQVHAVSRTGAQGLMQLMPGTAAALGVRNAFVADQNVEGGTKYLDELLTRYKDNIALALAAYNAGPAAVDRYHGVPPYRETRAYVVRVIREFNRRKMGRTKQPVAAPTLIAQAK